ncbi:TetR/AcrR family transcriptional regulator [Rossellomorea marisflavi]|uniref:TetR/AcrR family transcriptional regulator n=1 Tax=Rossellomorea marisflavi TaxID=189381 RepID=UPI00203C175D|nr:TetR/AcrR family transcriptional regulator [Rossellomorea marisflavi]MCM2603364.1 TetR/AcrR family transcriptional regulator [Rossellomorea marisflavi]USK93026.1 TetR/AcrR family transcriptional regulator [Rossellomorea marisflavi]
MKSNELKAIALEQFALHGYQGASLSAIADKAGIKKQSIYSHFKSKEDLFIRAFEDSVQHELDFIDRYLARNELPIIHTLNQFLPSYLTRYGEDSNMKFFLRTSFFPPVELEEAIKEGTEKYITGLEALFVRLFERYGRFQSDITPEKASVTYLTILDGLLVELLYGRSERLEKRLEHSLEVFWKGINEKECHE